MIQRSHKVAPWLILTAVLAVGCFSPQGRDADPRNRATLRTALRTDVHSLDPAINFEVTGLTFVRLLYEGLIDYGDDSRIVPWLAEEVPVSSADGRSYTFRIKKNVHFTNGRELVAEDFVYCLERVLDPQTKSPGDGYYRNIRGAEAFQKAREREAEEAGDDAPKRRQRWIEPTRVAGLQAVDRHTFRVELEKPDPAFLCAMTMPFAYAVPREAVEEHGDDFYRRPVGTGPFVLADWQRGMRLRFDRRRDYHTKQERHLAAIDVMIGPEEFTQQMMFERGELDLLFAIPAPDFVRLTRDPRWQPCIHHAPLNDVNYISLNCQMAPFTDRRVRQAMNHSVDRQRILKLVNQRGILANGVLPPQMPGYNPHLKGYDYDPELARKLLVEAGHANGFSFALWVAADNEYRVKIAQSVQQDLKAIGVDAEVKPVAFAIYDEATSKPKTAKAAVCGWTQDYPDPSDFLDVLFNGERITDSHCNNASFYANPEVDALLKQAAREIADPARRLRLYQQAEERIVRDAPCVFLYHSIDYRLVQPWVRGYAMHAVWAVRFEKLWIELP